MLQALNAHNENVTVNFLEFAGMLLAQKSQNGGQAARKKAIKEKWKPLHHGKCTVNATHFSSIYA